jgi:hypothetical protein
MARLARRYAQTAYNLIYKQIMHIYTVNKWCNIDYMHTPPPFLGCVDIERITKIATEKYPYQN